MQYTIMKECKPCEREQEQDDVKMQYTIMMECKPCKRESEQGDVNECSTQL